MRCLRNAFCVRVTMFICCKNSQSLSISNEKLDRLFLPKFPNNFQGLEKAYLLKPYKMSREIN